MKALDNIGNPVQSYESDLSETQSSYNTLAEASIVISFYKRAISTEDVLPGEQKSGDSKSAGLQTYIWSLSLY
jgi:hypothetical protein